jgi:hypothetical protein
MIVPPTIVPPTIVPPPVSASPADWWPVRPTGSPWLRPKLPPIEYAGERIVACGPELLRAADATISPSVRRRPVAVRRSR